MNTLLDGISTNTSDVIDSSSIGSKLEFTAVSLSWGYLSFRGLFP